MKAAHRPGWVTAALALLALLSLLATPPAVAHKASDSYLSLEQQPAGLSGQWDIALRDLEQAIGLDADGNGEITWGELRTRQPAIAALALAHLQLQADGAACVLHAGEQLVDEHTDGSYAVLRFRADCPTTAPRTLSVRYDLFAEMDPQHRGLLRLQAAGSTRTAIFSPQAPTQRFDLAASTPLAEFTAFAREGVWHIWIGFDHILFLVSLLLPAVFVWQRNAWQPAGRFRHAFFDVLKIVTAFTLAHSVTLTLATLGVVTLPSRLVESAIAASVVLAALNNLFPLVHSRRWAVAFGFGLVHGFGFASVLADLGLPQGTLALALVGFNLGVEAGQLAIVAAFLPLAFWLRRSLFYRRVVFVGGSILIVLLAATWMAERVFDLKLLPA